MKDAKKRGPINEIEGFNLPTLKKECIIRGMPFEIVATASIPALYEWLDSKFNSPKDYTLLEEFDKFRLNILKATSKAEQKGWIENWDHPDLQISVKFKNEVDRYTQIDKTTKKVVTRQPRKPSKKRVKNSLGIVSGTKKALTFELQSKGLPLDEVIQLVTDQFPDAKPDSISIWYKKSKRQNQAKEHVS
jgi:hypothetical protein